MTMEGIYKKRGSAGREVIMDMDQPQTNDNSAYVDQEQTENNSNVNDKKSITEAQAIMGTEKPNDISDNVDDGRTNGANPNKDSELTLQVPPNDILLQQAKKRVYVQQKKANAGCWDNYKEDAQVIANACSILGFIITFNMKSIYKLPYPLIGNLMDWDPEKMPLGWWAHDTLLVLLLWALLCGRKLVLLITWRRVNPHITQRTHDLTVLKENGEDTVVIPEERPQKTTKCPKKCGYVIVLTASYTFIGVWLGWASNFNLGYVPSDLEIAMSGLALFILAEVVLVGSSVYIMIKHCRLMSTLWVSVLETLSTTGFMLLTFTLPSCVLLLVRIIICSYQAYRHKICS